MRLPCSSKIVSHGPLLIAMLVWSGSALSAEAASAESRVAQAARELVLEQAKTAGLLKPAVEITVVSRDSANVCAKQISVAPIDTRYLTRMRFAAVCDAELAWRSEFVVRAALTADVVVTTAEVKAGRPIEATQIAVE